MIDYFAANDIAAFNVVSGAPQEATSGIDTTYTPRGLQPNSGVLQTPPLMTPTTGVTATLTSLWFHCDLSTGNNPGLNSTVEFVNSSGVSVVRFVSTTNTTFRMDYWNGAAFVAGATTFSPGSVLGRLDINIICGVSGSINWYWNGTLVATTTGLNAAVDNVQSVKILGVYILSQILVSDTNTIGAKVASLKPTGAGANTAWSPNTFSNIEKQSFNDATFIADSTLGDKVSYAAADATMPAGMFISSLWFAARARVNSVSPANIKPLLRIGGTDYAGSYNLGGLNSVSFAAAVAAYVNDPSTGVAWTLTNANAAEVGFQTAA